MSQIHPICQDLKDNSINSQRLISNNGKSITTIHTPQRHASPQASLRVPPLKMQYVQSPQENLANFMNQNNINLKYTKSIHKLSEYQTILVLDDSTDMVQLAYPMIIDSIATKWDELKLNVKLILDTLRVLG